MADPDIKIYDDPRSWDFQTHEPTPWEGETEEYAEGGIGNRGAWIIRVTRPDSKGMGNANMIHQEIVYVEEEIEAQKVALEHAKPGDTIEVVRYANAGVPDDNEVRRIQQETQDSGGDVSAIPAYMRDLHNQ